MLTSDLIRVRIQSRRINPSFVDPEKPALLQRAGELLALYTRGTAEHWSRGHLKQEIRELEGTSTDHKLLRGLSKVLEDKCDFETVCPMEPSRLRDLVFRHAARTGPLFRHAGPTGRRTAHTVLAEIASQIEQPEDGRVWTPADLHRALYADLKSEQLLTTFSGPTTPTDLLHRYNSALVQALLLRATGLTVHLEAPDPKRLRQLIRYLKFFQLMFRLSRTDETVTLSVDGPQSLLKQSTRYGLQLATFFPAVLLQPGGWELEAEVLWGRKRKLRKQLTLSHQRGLRSHYKDRGSWRSNIELWFEERFQTLDTPWTLAPGVPLDLGGQSLLVPDFTFRHGARVGHLDIVGFWRRGYLRQRLAQTPPNVILAVSRNLAGESRALPKTLQRQIIEFAKVIPGPAVVERLEAVALPPA